MRTITDVKVPDDLKEVKHVGENITITINGVEFELSKGAAFKIYRYIQDQVDMEDVTLYLDGLSDDDELFGYSKQTLLNMRDEITEEYQEIKYEDDDTGFWQDQVYAAIESYSYHNRDIDVWESVDGRVEQWPMSKWEFDVLRMGGKRKVFDSYEAALEDAKGEGA